MAAACSKTIVCLDPRLLRALKTVSDKTGRPADEILEEALHLYVAVRYPDVEADLGPPDLIELLSRLRASHPDDPSDEEAQRIAYDELHAMRGEGRQS